jgi:murein DD-endopeptidase MepM/ murein hydrolase activator NlpD
MAHPRPLDLMDPPLEGPDVADVQRALGFTGNQVDGIYGPNTAAAVEEWKWRVGYPAERITNRLAIPGLAWLHGNEELPAEFKQRARLRKDKPYPTKGGFVRPVATDPGITSEFDIRDPEGAPDKNGVRYHAAKDWFAPGGSPVRAPVTGRVVEVKKSRGNTGQVFGGTVKIEAEKDHRIWVFRHVDPRGVRAGERVDAGTVVANITAWKSGPSHVHIELWKTLAGGYNKQNMLDPMRYIKV